MDDKQKELKAKTVYASLCAALDNRKWNYDKNDEDLSVEFTVSGEDIPMHYYMFVDTRLQLVRVLSPMPFVFSEPKRLDGALAVCIANFGLGDGGFDYDIKNGIISYRQNASFVGDSAVNEELFNYLVECPCAMVDFFNDKFLALDKGLIDINKFASLREKN